MTFVSNALIPKILPAFEHVLDSYASGVLLNVYLIDNQSTRIKLPATPWQISNNLEHGDIWVSDDEDLKVIHQPSKNLLLMLNLITNEAIYWVNDANQIPYYESSAPLRPILHWWMSKNGAQLLHAAAVGLPDKGVLLVGKGGSGKSNTALSCLDSKLYYLSDDYCLLSFNPMPIVNNLFSTGKLHFDDLRRYPNLESTQYNSITGEQQDEKALFFLYPKYKNRIINSFPIKAVFIPKVTNRKNAKLIPVSAAKAYLALAPSTIFQIHGENKKTHKNISNLLKQVPCFSLELSSEAKENTTVIYNFLNKMVIE